MLLYVTAYVARSPLDAHDQFALPASVAYTLSYRVIGPVFGRRVLKSRVADLVFVAELLPQQVHKRVVHPEGRIRGRTIYVCHVTYSKFKSSIPVNTAITLPENIFMGYLRGSMMRFV